MRRVKGLFIFISLPKHELTVKIHDAQVGQKNNALQTLHETITNKRQQRNWTKALEQVSLAAWKNHHLSSTELFLRLVDTLLCPTTDSSHTSFIVPGHV